MSPALFMLYLMYLMTKESFIYHFHSARMDPIITHIFINIHHQRANDYLNQNCSAILLGYGLLLKLFSANCHVNILSNRRGWGSPPFMVQKFLGTCCTHGICIAFELDWPHVCSLEKLNHFNHN